MTKDRNNKLLVSLPYGVNVKFNVHTIGYRYVAYAPFNYSLYYRKSHALAGRWAAFNNDFLMTDREFYLEKKK